MLQEKFLKEYKMGFILEFLLMKFKTYKKYAFIEKLNINIIC